MINHGSNVLITTVKKFDSSTFLYTALFPLCGDGCSGNPLQNYRSFKAAFNEPVELCSFPFQQPDKVAPAELSQCTPKLIFDHSA